MMSFIKFIVIFLSISNLAFSRMLFDSNERKGTFADNILELLQKMRIRMHMHMNDLGIPRLDPFTVNGLGLGTEFLHGASLSTTNVNVTGLKSFTTNEVNFNIFGMEFLLDFVVPTISLSGEYEAHGLIGKVFPFRGKGLFNIEICNVTLKCDGRLRYSNNNWSIPDLNTYFAIDEFKGGFENLSDNFINEMLNDSGPEILKELWPFMEPSVADAAKKFIMQQLEQKSLEDLLNEILKSGIDWPPVEPNC